MNDPSKPEPEWRCTRGRMQSFKHGLTIHRPSLGRVVVQVFDNEADTEKAHVEFDLKPEHETFFKALAEQAAQQRHNHIGEKYGINTIIKTARKAYFKSASQGNYGKAATCLNCKAKDAAFAKRNQAARHN